MLKKYFSKKNPETKKKKKTKKMKSGDIFQLACFAFVVLTFVFLLWERFQIQETISACAETNKTMIHKCIKDAIMASKMTDPTYALCFISEARATIMTLSKIQGGDKILGSLCGIDIVNILNILTMQEAAIRDNIPNWMRQQNGSFDEKHPLANENNE